jgi:uncharacterized protein YxjI
VNYYELNTRGSILNKGEIFLFVTASGTPLYLIQSSILWVRPTSDSLSEGKLAGA